MNIQRKKFQNDDLKAIQAILRKAGNIVITHVDEDDMRFYLRGENKLDYGVLEQVKEELQKRKFLSFVLSADEYVKTGRKYFFSTG